MKTEMVCPHSELFSCCILLENTRTSQPSRQMSPLPPSFKIHPSLLSVILLYIVAILLIMSFFLTEKISSPCGLTLNKSKTGRHANHFCPARERDL